MAMTYLPGGASMKKQMLRGYLFAILSAVIYGCMPLMAKHIYDDGVSAMTLVFLGNILALPSLIFLAYRKHKTLKIPIKVLPHIGLISLIGCCITPTMLFSSYNYLASGTATVFHFIYPSIVVLAGILFLKKKAQMGTLISVALCFTGICLFYQPGESLNLTGSVLALCSGCTFATYVVMLSNFRHGEVSGFLFSFYTASCVSVIMFFVCLLTGQLALPATLTGWGLCFLFASIVTTGALVLSQQATFTIGGEKTSILSTLEPITSIVIGIVIFGEPVSVRVLIGSVLVIAASVLIAFFDLKKAQNT